VSEGLAKLAKLARLARLARLATLCVTDIRNDGKTRCGVVPEPRLDVAELIALSGISNSLGHLKSRSQSSHQKIAAVTTRKAFLKNDLCFIL